MKGAPGKLRVWRDAAEVVIEIRDLDNNTQGSAVIPVEEFRVLWSAVEKVVETLPEVR